MNCPECETFLKAVVLEHRRSGHSYPAAECPQCGWFSKVSDKHIILGALASYKDAQDDYDGPPDDPEAWSGGFAENH